MEIVIGIDVGISTTKIVGLKDGRVTAPIRITAADPITSLYGAFGKYLHDNSIELSAVDQVMLTGVGSAYIKGPVYGLPTTKVEEFVADGLGARYESKLDHTIVVSMGTGTSFVLCDGNEMRHIGGIGVGGGTLAGLSRLLLNTSDIKQVASLAMQGEIQNVNLLIGDISAEPLPNLPMDATASILAKTYRDDCMLALHKEYPCYSWDRNKGYPAPAHRQAIRQHGPSPYHRMTFNLLGEDPQLQFDF